MLANLDEDVLTSEIPQTCRKVVVIAPADFVGKSNLDSSCEPTEDCLKTLPFYEDGTYEEVEELEFKHLIPFSLAEVLLIHIGQALATQEAQRSSSSRSSRVVSGDYNLHNRAIPIEGGEGCPFEQVAQAYSHHAVSPSSALPRSEAVREGKFKGHIFRQHPL